MEKLLELEKAVRQAGQVLLNYWPGEDQASSPELKAQQKKDGSFVTQADLESNQILIEALNNLYPGQAIYSEEIDEKVELGKDGKFWLVDPLDGTHSFMDGNDDFSILVSLCENFRPVFGILYFPVRKTFCLAKKGSFKVNDKEVFVSKSEKIRAGSIYIRRFEPLRSELVYPKWVDSGLAWVKVASGEFDGAILCLKHHQEWDLAPAVAAIEGAGGVVTNEKGEPFPFRARAVQDQYFVASNKIVHQELLKMIP